MFYYPKSFTLKSLLTSQEVFTNVARFALHLIPEKKRTMNIGESLVIAVALAIRPARCASAVLLTYLWELTQLPVIISLFSEPITLSYASMLYTCYTSNIIKLVSPLSRFLNPFKRYL